MEPPGTPPPPYASGSSIHLYPSDEMDENYSFIANDVSTLSKNELLDHTHLMLLDVDVHVSDRYLTSINLHKI